MNPNTIRILLVDDHLVVRDGLAPMTLTESAAVSGSSVDWFGPGP